MDNSNLVNALARLRNAGGAANNPDLYRALKRARKQEIRIQTAQMKDARREARDAQNSMMANLFEPSQQFVQNRARVDNRALRASAAAQKREQKLLERQERQQLRREEQQAKFREKEMKMAEKCLDKQERMREILATKMGQVARLTTKIQNCERVIARAEGR